jgi:mannonate dehydratase
MAAMAGGLGVFTERAAKVEAQVARATRGMPSPKIKDIQVIATQPDGVRLTVVKILTDQDGLYGYGCGTFTQRAELVNAAVERYLKPFLLGKPADRIDDIWQACYNSSYWRNGPVLNNAISGVDQALWDIKGRQAGMPVYQLLGGKCREAATCFATGGGRTAAEVVDTVRKFMAAGYQHVRVTGAPRDGSSQPTLPKPPVEGARGDRAARLRNLLGTFEEIRKQLGDGVELMTDIHEGITPQQAMQFAKDCEQFRLFFIEDILSPEDIAYFRLIRQQCTTPMAMGELFNSPHEWTPLIAERLIDYIRIHVSQAGGITPCRKIAALGEFFGVKTAWHGPGDLSPVGWHAQLALDLACYNFGIQEYNGFSDRVKEVFKGCPRVEVPYMYANEAPGYGMEVDEKAAARFPYGNPNESPGRGNLNGGWGDRRLPDGTVIKM